MGALVANDPRLVANGLGHRVDGIRVKALFGAFLAAGAFTLFAVVARELVLQAFQVLGDVETVPVGLGTSLA